MENKINEFVALMHEAQNSHFESGDAYVFQVKMVPGFAKIIRHDIAMFDQTSRSRLNGHNIVAAFVNLTTGDIHDAASRKLPVKGISGNVNIDNGKSALDSWGAIRYAG